MFILKTCEISTKILSTLLIELNKIIISDNSEAYLMVFKAVAMSGASFFFCACCCYLWSQWNWCGGNGSLKYNLISIMCFRLLVYHISSISNPYLNTRCLCLFLGEFVFPNKIVFMLSSYVILANTKLDQFRLHFFYIRHCSHFFGMLMWVLKQRTDEEIFCCDSIIRGETNIIIIS